jgi:hypothetical protein
MVSASWLMTMKHKSVVQFFIHIQLYIHLQSEVILELNTINNHLWGRQ